MKVELSGFERCFNHTAHHDTVPSKHVNTLLKEHEDLRSQFKALSAVSKTSFEDRAELSQKYLALYRALKSIAANTCCGGCGEAARVAQGAINADGTHE